jgi:hypothetical protein
VNISCAAHITTVERSTGHNLFFLFPFDVGGSAMLLTTERPQRRSASTPRSSAARAEALELSVWEGPGRNLTDMRLFGEI